MDYVQYNWLYSLIGIVIYMIMLWISHPGITYNNPLRNNNRDGFVLFFFLYIFNSVYGLWEWDTYHIWDDFIGSGQYTNFEITGYEAIYNWLASVTGNNYWLWRSIIWIPACLFIYYSAKKLSLLNRNFLVSLAIFGGFLAFTRGMLGHTMLIYGLILLFSSDSNKLAQILGILIIIVSYFFHKSMYINIIFAILALIPFGKKLIKTSIPLFPIAIIIASLTVEIILVGEVAVSYAEGVGGVGDRTLDYLNKEKSEVNFNGYISQVITIVPIYLTILYLYKKIYIARILDKFKDEALYKYFFRLCYVAIYISSAYYFTESSEWISQRFRYMALFPLVFILGKVWSVEQKTNIYVKAIIILQLLSIAFKYALQLSDWYVL